MHLQKIDLSYDECLVSLMKVIVQLCLAILAVTLSAEQPLRTWTSADGRTIEARLVGITDGKVKLAKVQGRPFSLPISKFSQGDQEYLKKIISNKPSKRGNQSEISSTDSGKTSLFSMPKPFANQGKGAIIVTYTKGSVEVLERKKPDSNYTEEYGDAVDEYSKLLVGEILPIGSTMVTGIDSEAHLLLTNGTLAYVGPQTQFRLVAFWQNEFDGSNQNAVNLVTEPSASRMALELVEGNLVVEVKKLKKSSSLWIKTQLAHAGIRGTKFSLSASQYLTSLSVAEGRVDLMDTKQNVQTVSTSRKTVVQVPARSTMQNLSALELANIRRILSRVRKSSNQFTQLELSETVAGFSRKATLDLESLKDLQLIFVRPGKTISPSKPGEFVLIRKGFYMSKYEITNQQYLQVMNPDDPSEFNPSEASVGNISWHKANEFCEILTRQERQKGTIPEEWEFSLPAEEEWLYANSAGSGKIYWWGSSFAEDNATMPHPWGFEQMNDNHDEWSSTVANKSSTNPNTWYRLVMTAGSNYRNSSSRWSRPLSRVASPREEREYVGFRICLRKP